MFNYVTVDQLIKEHPDEKKHEALYRQLANLPDRLCSNCEQDQVWKFGQCDMCFACTTGESDKSDDYELIADKRERGRA